MEIGEPFRHTVFLHDVDSGGEGRDEEENPRGAKEEGWRTDHSDEDRSEPTACNGAE